MQSAGSVQVVIGIELDYGSTLKALLMSRKRGGKIFRVEERTIVRGKIHDK